MKLSELINYRNQLNLLSVDLARADADRALSEITQLVQDQSMQFENLQNNLLLRQDEVNQSFVKFDQELDQLKDQITKSISIAEKPWFVESYRLYEEEMCHETPEYILNRRSSLINEAKMVLRARIMNYTDWRFPAMIIRPGDEEFINDMVGYDPLYIIDEHYDLLTPAMNKFPENYQKRLRPYLINERTSDNILDKIPNGQFGICLAYNFFNFRPFEIIRRYLEEIYTKLRPGGALIMTFNDCDRDKGVILVEQHFACYTPGYLVKELAQSIGYTISFSWHNDGPDTWLELKKPGELTSIRGGQTLAKIISK